MFRVLMLACAVVIGGCATVSQGTTEQIQFDSDPPGAVMRSVIPSLCGDESCPPIADKDGNYVVAANTVEPGPACTTPCLATVRRHDRLIATFTKDGYVTQTVRVETKVAGAGVVGMAGNAIIGGVAGAGVDAVSGAMLEHVPNPVMVKLVPVGRPAAPAFRRR
jgi:hypothetical protein